MEIENGLWIEKFECFEPNMSETWREKKIKYTFSPCIVISKLVKWALSEHPSKECGEPTQQRSLVCVVRARKPSRIHRRISMSMCILYQNEVKLCFWCVSFFSTFFRVISIIYVRAIRLQLVYKVPYLVCWCVNKKKFFLLFFSLTLLIF